MKFFSAICVTALALGSPTPTLADTYTPATPGVSSLIFQGSVLFKRGLSSNCTFKLVITIPQAAPDSDGTFSHGHSARATPILAAPGDFPCSSTTFSGAPYAVSFNGTFLTITNVVVNTLTPGGCSGALSGTWGGNNTPQRFIYFNNASLPGGGTSEPCTITGTLYQVSGSSLSITSP
ncbi:MAG: hypothetical protein P0Y59_17990 [Candidatus Sphingomonas phytovorans]|nr:hypothetical protein [Sphingomonas sp.]WEJ98814.1 MAG: hypothetical protein P0Y59_17990 [Sphingomonas sp.]